MIISRLLQRNIFTCLLSMLSIACQHAPATDTQTQSFADRWHLTPRQRSEFNTKISALDVQYRWKVLEHHKDEEIDSKRLLSLAIQMTQSGRSSRSDLLLMQTQLSKDKIHRLQGSEQLRIAERIFNKYNNSAASVEEVLSGRVAAILPMASEEEAFAALGNIPGQQSIPGIQDQFSALWARYETSKAINNLCRILVPISSRMTETNNMSLQVGMLSVGGYARLTRESNQQQLECLLHRHELDNIEVKLSVLLNAGTAISERP